jgi:DNA processing protein
MSEPISAELQNLLALQMVPGLGPRRISILLERFGSANRALQATAADLAALSRFGEQSAQETARALREVDVEGELARMERAGVHALALGSPGYPAPLTTISTPPHVLYVRGTLTPTDARAVAVVGSRRCTPYGRRMAERLAAGLVRAGVTVVSGLARGIDGAAHRGALQAGGRTLAVLAGGLSRIYPPEHKNLAEEVANAGALLTESSMEQEPLAGLFPARNRIISGLSQAVVIVEADDRSGALITASHAAEQGRSVLAVPGPVDAQSGGCHALIRQGAVLCRSVEDILEELDGVSAVASQSKAEQKTAAPAARPAPSGPPPGLDDDQQRVWDFLGTGARSVDEIAQQLGLAVIQLVGILLMLEMKKAVRRLPGNRYERC